VKIRSITSITANGLYKKDSPINVTVIFTKPVTLAGGSLDVTLNTGGTVSVSASSYPSRELSGMYTVRDTDMAADLDATGLALSGGTLRDHLDRDVDLTPPTLKNTLAYLKDIAVDGIAPVITSIDSSSSCPNPDGSFHVGDSIEISVHFSEPVILESGSLVMALDLGNTVTVSAAAYPSQVLSGAYVVAEDDDSADLNATGAILSPLATLRDTAGNDAILDIPPDGELSDNEDIVVDGIAPFVTSVTSTSGNGIYGRGTTVNVTVQFNESVTLAGGMLTATIMTNTSPEETEDVTLSVNPLDDSEYIGSYEVANGDYNEDLDSTRVLLSGGTLRDRAGYDAILTIPAGQSLSDNKDISIDGNSPTINAIDTPDDDNTYGIGSTITITLHFSEAVTLSGGTIDLTLNSRNGTTAQVAHVAEFTDSSTASATYTVSENETTAGIKMMVTDVELSGGTLKSAASGNDVVVGLPGSIFTSDTIIIDGIRPTITSVSSEKAGGTYGTGELIDVTVTFSETVVLSSGTLDVELNSGGTLNITTFTGGSAGINYTVQAGQSTAGLRLGSSAISTSVADSLADEAGNTIASLTPASNISATRDIYIDATLPVITTAETGDADSDGHIDYYRLTFSKAVFDASFPGYAANSVGDEQTTLLVAGYSNVRLAHGTAATALGVTDMPNDAILYVMFNEGTACDTAAKPDVTYTQPSPTTGLKDYINSGSNSNFLADAGVAAVSETDRAAPVIVAFRGRVGYDDMSIEFSEPVDADGGACGQNLEVSDFEYIDTNGTGANSIDAMVDADGCDSYVSLILNDPLALEDMGADRVRPAENAIFDAAGNPASGGDAADGTVVEHTRAPYVLGVNGYRINKIRITFSEAMDATTGTNGACNLSNYTLIEDPVEIGCSGTGSDAIAIDTGAPITPVSPDVYEITTTGSQCSTTTYRLTVANVQDLEGNDLIDPMFGTFLGSEQLKVASATCLTINSMMVVFNKPVMSDPRPGSSYHGADEPTRYKYNNSLLGSISAAVLGTGVNTGQVTLTHTSNQFGATFMVIGSNAIDGDGFNDSALGAIQTDDGSESLQQSPRDRAYWNGCAEPIISFDGGPISLDPFGDGSDFGYLALYNNKVYIGPNKNGNSSCRMDPDGSNPVLNYFTFNRDTSSSNSTEIMENNASSRDGGIAVPPYVTIGHTGCTNGTANINTGCGPDNENGRGLFVNGTVSGTERLFITGGKSSGNNDYIYWTSDTDSTLDFQFVDLSATFNSDSISGNRGTESIIVMNNKVYWMEPGDYYYRPYFVKLNDLTAQSASGSNSQWMYIRYMTGIGQHSGSKPNKADRIGGTLFVFNDKLYVANNGSVRNTSDNNYDEIRPGCNATTPDSYSSGCGFLGLFACENTCTNTGGIVRSTNNDPAPCSGADNCSNWTDITPDSNTSYTNYFSRIYGKVSGGSNQLADAIPADRPVPAFAEYKGNLYMIRNACTTNMINMDCTTSGTNSCTDDVNCPSGSEIWQLWKCVPGADGDCDKTDWSLVMQRSSSGSPITTETDIRERDNVAATMLVANGDYLYVGFDNLSSTGLEIWRTNDSTANGPDGYGDFSQIGGDGLGYPSIYKRLWSAITITDGSYHYIYVSAGNTSQPVAIFRQRND